jgi:dienelactone hydrolase
MVDAFTTEAELHQARLTVIDVPDGQHGFDTLDHNEGSREAVTQAMTRVVSHLQF